MQIPPRYVVGALVALTLSGGAGAAGSAALDRVRAPEAQAAGMSRAEVEAIARAHAEQSERTTTRDLAAHTRVSEEQHRAFEGAIQRIEASVTQIAKDAAMMRDTVTRLEARRR